MMAQKIIISFTNPLFIYRITQSTPEVIKGLYNFSTFLSLYIAGHMTHDNFFVPAGFLTYQFSAETVIYEAFIVIGELGWGLSSFHCLPGENG